MRSPIERGPIMPVVISDETLTEAGLSEREAVVEFACRLFDAGKLTLWSGARLAHLSRVQFERELLARQIALYRPTVAELEADLEALNRLGISPWPSS
jgi:predicted HTH domain antitoxin